MMSYVIHTRACAPIAVTDVREVGKGITIALRPDVTTLKCKFYLPRRLCAGTANRSRLSAFCDQRRLRELMEG